MVSTVVDLALYVPTREGGFLVEFESALDLKFAESVWRLEDTENG